MENLAASSSPGIKIYPMSPSRDHVTSERETEKERTLTISLNNHQKGGGRRSGEVHTRVSHREVTKLHLENSSEPAADDLGRSNAEREGGGRGADNPVHCSAC